MTTDRESPWNKFDLVPRLIGQEPTARIEEARIMIAGTDRNKHDPIRSMLTYADTNPDENSSLAARQLEFDTIRSMQSWLQMWRGVRARGVNTTNLVMAMDVLFRRVAAKYEVDLLQTHRLNDRILRLHGDMLWAARPKANADVHLVLPFTTPSGSYLTCVIAPDDEYRIIFMVGAAPDTNESYRLIISASLDDRDYVQPFRITYANAVFADLLSIDKAGAPRGRRELTDDELELILAVLDQAPSKK